MSDARLVMITVYDYPTARAFDLCGFDYFLVGDSVGMVELGLKDTKSVTMAMVIHHLEAVKRGTTQTHLIADMPIHTYDTLDAALDNAHAFLNAGADSVKVEGPCMHIVSHLRQDGIEVIGHIGLTPQTSTDFKMKGTDPAAAKRLGQEARDLERAGCYALILEHMPAALAAAISAAVSIPTIGIGAGPHTGGQVLVSSDLLGLYEKVPPFAKKYADLRGSMINAAETYIREVKDGTFPSEEYYKG
ncbi:3-methyl-2-oxobutanoate hydroxymethyltransferase [Planctomycetota bacterium]